MYDTHGHKYAQKYGAVLEGFPDCGKNTDDFRLNPYETLETALYARYPNRDTETRSMIHGFLEKIEITKGHSYREVCQYYEDEELFQEFKHMIEFHADDTN